MMNPCANCLRLQYKSGLRTCFKVEICDNLSSQGVSVRRIEVRRNNELVPTNTLILTFNMPSLPRSVKARYLYIPAVPYIQNPLPCFKCPKFGHGQNTWRGKLTCTLWSIVTMLARHLPRTWNAQIARENTLHTQESAQGGNC